MEERAEEEDVTSRFLRSCSRVHLLEDEVSEGRGDGREDIPTLGLGRR